MCLNAEMVRMIRAGKLKCLSVKEREKILRVLDGDLNT